MSRRTAGGGGAVALPERLVATRCRGLFTFSAGANREVMSRTAHVANDDISSLKICISNFRLSSQTASEATIGASVTVTASVEYPAGTFKQITFAGSASAAIADAGVAFSDYTAGDLAIPSGATFWIRTFRVTSAAGILYNAWQNTAMGEVMRVGAPGAVPDRTMADPISGGTAGNWSAPPTLIIARTNSKSIMVFGDSKVAGNGDAAESTTAATPGLKGEIAKSLPASQPFVNLASGGLKAGDWNTAGILDGRKLMLAYFSHYFIDIGHNDIYVSTLTAAQTKANIETVLAGVMAANPDARITLGTIGQKSTSSSGNWISDADQSALALTIRTDVNTDIRSHAVVGQNNGHFEISRQLESVPDNGIWKNDGVTAKLYTSDGIHETPAGYDLIVAAGAIDYAAKLAS
jgi:lysophospholipase L1-like esterase